MKTKRPFKSQDELLRHVLQYRQMLTTYAYSILRDWDLAQDAVQEATISANKRWQDLENGPAFKFWIKRVTSNKAVDIIRERHRKLYFTDQVQDLLEDQFNELLESENAAERERQQQKLMRECMQKVRTENRDILHGFYKQKHSTEKLGSLFNKSSNAIRLILSKTRKSLTLCVNNKQQASEASP